MGRKKNRYTISISRKTYRELTTALENLEKLLEQKLDIETVILTSLNCLNSQDFMKGGK